MSNLQFAHMNDANAFSNLQSAAINFSTSGGNVLVTGVSKKRVLCYRLLLVVGGATNLTYQDGPSTNLTGAMPMLANGSQIFDLSNLPWFQTSPSNDLVLNSTNAVQVSGILYYQTN